jgi:hypothetical protein
MHHDRDWSQYNRQLIHRGKIFFWVSKEVLQQQPLKQKKNGHPLVYTDALIQAMCYLRFKYHLSLRETEGYFCSLMEFLQELKKVPCYTQICRRMKALKLPKELLSRKGVTDVVLDTTGLKVYGEGEWRAEKYGGRKSWRKLHLALDPRSGKLVLAEITEEHKHDTTHMEKALQRTNRRKGKVLIDGIADSQKCYELAHRYGKSLLTPPKKGSIFRREESLRERNEALGVIRALGGDRVARSIWSKLVGYNRRVIIESMISRWKRLYGGDLRSRSEIRQGVEVKIKARMINEMIERKAA